MSRPDFIYSDVEMTVLAPTKGAARALVLDNRGPGYDVEFVGWLADVGWDADEYDSREEFERESGYDGWWSCVQPPRDLRVTDDCCPGWRIIPVSTHKQD